jgi:hypothetical protein
VADNTWLKPSNSRADKKSRLSPSRLLFICLWVVIIIQILPMYLEKGLVEPVDYSEGGLGALDFTVYYVAARMVSAGRDIYAPELQGLEYQALNLTKAGIYTYPSLLVTILAPLGALPLEQAARIWNLMNLGLLCATVGLLNCSLDLKRRLGLLFPWVVILMAVAQPTLWAYRAGQSSILILFLLTLSFWALTRNERLGAAIIGVAGVVKVFPVAMVMLFLQPRRFQLLAWTLGTSAVLITADALVLLATGHDASADMRYFTVVLPSLMSPNAVPFNQSLNGFVSTLGLPHLATLVVTAGLSLLVVGITYAPSRSAPIENPSVSFASWLLAVLLITSITEASTLVLTVIPFYILAAVWADRKSIGLMLILAACYLMVNSIALASVVPPTSAMRLLTFLPLAGVFLLWSLTIWERHNSPNLGSPALS